LDGEYEWFEELVLRHPYHLDEDEKILEELHHAIATLEARAVALGKADCPIAFFQPSWEQAQCMNAWHPEFEPATAPEGFRSVANFSAVRVGKSWGKVADTILWMIPNDRCWPLFEPYIDHLQREVRVLHRPNWDYWWRTGKMVEPDKNDPPKSECDIWQGVVDENHWHHKIEKVYKRLFPDKYVLREN